MRIGVDVGDTHTDVVLMAGADIVYTHKTPAAGNAIDSALLAVDSILRNTRVQACEIDSVAIATTQLARAFRERRDLARVGVLRFEFPAAPTAAPLEQWPADLIDCLDPVVDILPGGYELQGRPVARLDSGEVRFAVDSMHQRGIRSLALSCVTPAMHPDVEQRAASLLRLAFPDVHLTLASKIGRGGPIERENTAIVNASLVPMARATARALSRELWRLNLNAAVFICRNDGTLMDPAWMARFPVLTFASGAAHSLRGAAHLSGRTHACVVDIGGTTTHVGEVKNGFLREASTSTVLDGVRVSFNRPELHVLRMGGASIVRRGADGTVRVGPECVPDLMTDALVFGGDRVTATDIAVAAGIARIGDRSRAAWLPPGLVKDALEVLRRQVDGALAAIRPADSLLPIVLSGGGTSVLPRSPDPTSQTTTPTHHAVAGAVGAATGLVSGEVDRVYSYKKLSRAEALEKARNGAVRAAVEAGAVRKTVEVREITETPIGNGTGTSVRVRVRAVGRAPG